MTDNPRKIGESVIEFDFTSHDFQISRKNLDYCVKTCPVALSE